MLRMSVLMLGLAACGPVSAVVIADGDGLVDPDPDTDVDSDTDADTEPLPDPVYGEWFGQRLVQIGRCAETIQEFGTLIESPDLTEACPDCELFYEVFVEPDSVCRAPVQTPAYRGLIFEDEVQIFSLVETDRGWVADELAQGFYEESDGDIVFGYQYDGTFNGFPFEVEGQGLLIRTE